MGLSHVPLANIALDALEDWSSHIPSETMQHCYTIVLPLLDGYLKTTSTDSKTIILSGQVDGRFGPILNGFQFNKRRYQPISIKSDSDVVAFRQRRQQLGSDVIYVFKT